VQLLIAKDFMSDARTVYDTIIIGGGPAGATAALCLARRGRRVVIIEKNTFPRFHVGESFLPRGYDLVHELGLGDRLASLPHVPKFGAEFGFGSGEETTCFSFDDALHNEGSRAFNIERAPFDNMLLDAAIEAGVEVRMGATVKRILRLSEGDVAIDLGGETLSGRCLIDASGQATVVGRHLGLRRTIERYAKVAYFGHFENVERLPGDSAGHPTVAMCDEGWFWMINIDEHRTSIGFVIDANIAKTIDCPASDMLRWGIERCPLVRERLTHATLPSQTHTIADYSYYCRPFASPGYFLVGDAAFFLDPIFSSGVALGMEGAVKSAELVDELLAGQDSKKTSDARAPRTPDRIRREYVRFLDDSAAPFVKLVDMFYHHGFRELFLHGHGPFQVERATISVLAGYVFPKPRWSLRWRIEVLAFFARVQRYLPLTPRRKTFSLRSATPVPLRQVESALAPA
jgi:flavin-dependent dehydrogenase